MTRKIVKRSSLNEKILETARTLTGMGMRTFSLETLVVACWRDDPRAFGLKGYSDQYPDSNRVIAALSGRNGLVRRFYLDLVAPKTYRLGNPPPKDDSRKPRRSGLVAAAVE